MSSKSAGGRPPRIGNAFPIAQAFTDFRERFDRLDDLLTGSIQGKVDLVELRHGLDAALGGFESWEEMDRGRSASKSPHEQVIAIAAALQYTSITSELVAAHAARLDKLRKSLEAALIAADVGRRTVDSYMAEFASRLQAEGVLKQHVRDMPKAKLVRLVDILMDAKLPPAREDDAPAVRNTVAETGMWDDLDLSGLPFEIIERDVVSEDDRAASKMRLPEVATARELGVTGGLFDGIVTNIETFGDTQLMVDRLLPTWEERSNVTLTPEERRAWTFLMVVVRYPDAVTANHNDLSFGGLRLPSPAGPSRIREVRAIGAATA